MNNLIPKRDYRGLYKNLMSRLEHSLDKGVPDDTIVYIIKEEVGKNKILETREDLITAKNQIQKLEKIIEALEAELNVLNPNGKKVASQNPYAELLYRYRNNRTHRSVEEYLDNKTTVPDYRSLFEQDM
jgi:uncharacterized protein YaiI (UPF0178 family)